MIVIFDEAKSTWCLVKSVQAHYQPLDLSTSSCISALYLKHGRGSILSEKLMYLLFGSVERTGKCKLPILTLGRTKFLYAQIANVKGRCIF